MQKRLTWSIAFISAVAAIISEVMLFRMFNPPDTTAALIGGGWVAMPYVGTIGMAMLVRRTSTALIVMLISLLLVSYVGVSALNSVADSQDESHRQVRDAVLLGEDPNSGPAGMRKSGADVGAMVTDVFAIAFVAFLPPVQLVVVVIPTLIGYGISALFRKPVGTPAVEQTSSPGGTR